jgi:hypothetical protein
LAKAFQRKILKALWVMTVGLFYASGLTGMPSGAIAPSINTRSFLIVVRPWAISLTAKG